MRRPCLLLATLAWIHSAGTAPAQQIGSGRPRQGASATSGQGEDGRRTVVRARKVEEELSDVPVAASVVDRETIDLANLDGVREAALLVPGVMVTEFSARRLSFPFVRGLGAGQGEPAVVTYVDGVPQLSTAGTNLPLMDVERIEFLRGPQGTLYGRNALGGLIHVTSRPPSFEPESGVQFSAGEYGYREVRAGTSGSIEHGRSAFRLSTQWSARDGWVENDLSGRSVGDREAWYGRGELLLQPSSRSRVSLRVHGERARDGGFALGFLEDRDGPGPLTGLREEPYRIQTDFEGFTHRYVTAPSVVYEHEGDAWDTTSVTALEAWDVTEESDFDFSPLDAIRRRVGEDQQYLYQELRWSTPGDDPGPAPGRNPSGLAWVFGLSGFGALSDRSATNDIRDDALFLGFDSASLGVDHQQGEFEDLGAAGFANLTLGAGGALELDLGARYDYESKSASIDHSFDGTALAPTQELDESFSEFVPRAAATWHLTQDSMVYVSGASGFKAGGFNLSAPSPQQQVFDPETSRTYELGTKHSLWGDDLDLSAAAFYTDWEDMQLSLFDPVAGGYVDNAGESRSRGVEVESRSALLFEGLELFGGWTFVDTEFDPGVTINGTDVSGNRLIFAPQESWSLGLQYSGELRRELTAFARADWIDVGEFFYDPENLGSEAYDLLNLQVGVRSENLHASVWVKNALGEEYVPVAFNAGSAAGPAFVGESGAPQIFGVTLRLTF